MHQEIRNLLLSLNSNEVSEEEFHSEFNKRNHKDYFNSTNNENVINIISGIKRPSQAIINVLEKCINDGLDFSLSSTNKMRTALFQCNKELLLAKLLIEKGANVNHQDIGKSTFIMYGTTYDIYKIAMAHQYDLNITNSNGLNFLFTLFNNIYNSSLEQIKILNHIVDNNLIDLNEFTSLGQNVLQFAFIHGNISHKALEILIQAGADPKLKTKNDFSFYNWNNDNILIPKGSYLNEILSIKLNSLIDDNKNGYITEQIYFEQGYNYFSKAIEIIE